MSFGSVVDKEVTAALVFDDLPEFFTDLFTHGMEYLRFLSFLPEKVKDLDEPLNKLFEQLDLMFIGGFIIIIPEKNVLLKIVAFIIDGVETGEVIAVFFNLLKALLNGEREVLDDGGDVLLAEGLFGLWLLLVGLHLGDALVGWGK